MGMPMGGMPGMNLSPTPAGAPMLPPGMTGQFTTPGMGGIVPAVATGYPGGGLMQTAGPINDNNIIRTGAPGGGPAFPVQRTQVRFAAPAGMKISWYTTQNDGKQGFGAQSLEAPGRYNFLQAAIYRLKLSDIPNRPGVELYPTLEVVPCNSKTSTFLAHSAVPVSFTDEDFEQVASGNMVVKVIYLPDPQFQDLATTGLAEVVSSQLEPGVDPIAEAQRRGSILLVVRVSNIDLEATNTPAMDAPGPNRPAGPPPGQIMNMQPNTSGMGRMVPYQGAPVAPNAPRPGNFPYPTIPNMQAMPPQQQQQLPPGQPQQLPPVQAQQQPPFPQGNIQAPGGLVNPFAQPLPFGQVPQGQPASRPLYPNAGPAAPATPAPMTPAGPVAPVTPTAPTGSGLQPFQTPFNQGSSLVPPPPLPNRPLPPPLGPTGQAPTTSGTQQASTGGLFLPGQR
jgi:hypothetical protein